MKENQPLQGRKAHKSSSSSLARKSASRRSSRREKTAVLGGANRTEDDRVRQLEERLAESEARLATSEARRNAAEEVIAAGAGPEREVEQPRGSVNIIPAPERLKDAKMRVLKAHLKMPKPRWNSLRTFGRHRLQAANLNQDLGWKRLDSYMLGIVARAINDRFPELDRFQDHWATYRIMKESWGNIKNYANCVDRPETYVGRKAAERQHQPSPARHPRRKTPPSPGSSRMPSHPADASSDSDSGSDSESGSSSGSGPGSESSDDDDDDDDDMVEPEDA